MWQKKHYPWILFFLLSQEPSRLIALFEQRFLWIWIIIVLLKLLRSLSITQQKVLDFPKDRRERKTAF